VCVVGVNGFYSLVSMALNVGRTAPGGSRADVQTDAEVTP
jgi:hypothetical protein